MQQGTTLPGDVLLVTAFISYVGCFTKQYRLDLVNKMWLPFLRQLDVRSRAWTGLPHTEKSKSRFWGNPTQKPRVKKN